MQHTIINLANHSFHLVQSDDTHNNGTTLWLGGRILSLYLLNYKPATSVIELGSGIGLTSLTLAAKGWSAVYATDTDCVIRSVLATNIQNNNPHIRVRELDWLVDPSNWVWDDKSIIASQQSTLSSNPLTQPFDLIVTADTVYEPSLVEPLFRAIHALCTQSRAVSPTSRAPPVLLCLDRRDPQMIDSVLEQASSKWHFHVQRVPSRKIKKAMEKNGVECDRSDWEGIEIWKLTL
ncbi:hypothetical protein D9758_003224 [Tetrapyrgos nigripes]|uniref:Uncharacterized protein n=1 Tax=Tetrapyrgos nigripes TaxID=182062 RepID=A0A8H5GII7_9AGAR|nr:hypothetical protein D9758_003224 [Tetrapyrgos nigripes]